MNTKNNEDNIDREISDQLDSVNCSDDDKQTEKKRDKLHENMHIKSIFLFVWMFPSEFF